MRRTRNISTPVEASTAKIFLNITSEVHITNKQIILIIVVIILTTISNQTETAKKEYQNRDTVKMKQRKF